MARFKARLQAEPLSLGFFFFFLISGLIYPISRGHLPCKPHKVHISALIELPFSDNSRVLKISDCYRRAVECHGSCSPPTATSNAPIKWGRVLLSFSSHSGLSSVTFAVKREKNKGVSGKPKRRVREDRDVTEHQAAGAAEAASQHENM